MSDYDFGPEWVDTFQRQGYLNSDKWFWQFWKPDVVWLPVYVKVLESGESIYMARGLIGKRLIEESLDNVG